MALVFTYPNELEHGIPGSTVATRNITAMPPSHHPSLLTRSLVKRGVSLYFNIYSTFHVFFALKSQTTPPPPSPSLLRSAPRSQPQQTGGTGAEEELLGSQQSLERLKLKW